MSERCRSDTVLLGLDLGTTAVKAVILDPDRGLLAAQSLPDAPASPAARVVGAGRRRVARERARARSTRVRRGRGGRPGDCRGGRGRLRAVRPAAGRSRPAPAIGAPLQRRARTHRDRRAHGRAGRRARVGAHGRGCDAAVRRPQAALAAAARARAVGAHAARRGLIRLARRATRRQSLQRAQLGARGAASTTSRPASLRPTFVLRPAWSPRCSARSATPPR